MKLLSHSLAILSVAILTQCVVVETPAPAEPESDPTPPDYTGTPSGSPEDAKRVYMTGFERGYEDGKEGLSRTPDRHKGTYDSRESDAFLMGYEKGYTEGIR